MDSEFYSLVTRNAKTDSYRTKDIWKYVHMKPVYPL